MRQRKYFVASCLLVHSAEWSDDASLSFLLGLNFWSDFYGGVVE